MTAPAHTTVALVRHGRTEWNLGGRLQGSSDVPLDEVGRDQARAAGRLLAAETWTGLVASPLRRAGETAEIVAAHLGLGAPHLCELLVERTYGIAEGLTREQAERQWPDGEFPGIESLAAVAARGRAALESVRDRHPGGRVVVVAHGALIRATAEALTGQPVPRILNGAVTTVTAHADAWTLGEVNLVRA